MFRRRLGLCFLASVLLAAGCDSDDDEPAGTPSGVATAQASGTASTIPSSTPTVEVKHTVWLLNLWDDEQYTIYEHADVPGLGASWVAPRVARSPGIGFFDEAGRSISYPATRCRNAPSGVEVAGTLYPEILGCGPTSPDGRYMLFEIEQEPGVYPPVTQQWVLDVETGESRLLQDHVRGCGGCDARFGPQWSPDGRYLLFAETLQDGRVFLVDLQTGESEVVATGTEIQFRPSWSPDDAQSIFLVRGEDGAAVLVNAETDERTSLPIGWPAVFDATGTLAYSPSAASGRVEAAVTMVLDLATREISEVPGVAPWSHLWSGDIAVAALEGSGYTATLEVEECAGTIVHSTGRASRCLDGGYGAVPSRNGLQVAFASLVEGEDVVVNGPRLNRYDIAVLDVETGDIEIVAEGSYSGPLAPRVQWSRFGDLLLVSWPHFAGL